MVSSISNSFILADAVSNIYTANSSAKLVKTAVDTYIKSSDSSDNIKEVINKVFNLYDDEDDENESLEFSSADFLREYTKNTSDYIKSFAEQNKSNNILKKEDYEKAGMVEYYDAQVNLQMSKAISTYSLNKNTQKSFNFFTFKV